MQIASRVEVFVSPPGVPVGANGSAAWRRLGFLSLDPNEQSGHQVLPECLNAIAKQMNLPAQSLVGT